MDELISIIEKEPEYTFYFDAQAAVIEDYLEIRPEKEKLLKRLIGKGNIVIGPGIFRMIFTSPPAKRRSGIYFSAFKNHGNTEGARWSDTHPTSSETFLSCRRY